MFRASRRIRLLLHFAAGGVSLAMLTACSAFGSGAPEPAPLPSASAVPSEPAKDPALASFYSQRLTWAGCGDGFECAELQVPIDYANPDGSTIMLALVRLTTSAKGADRLGSLVLNPGGPGGSGVEYARAATSQVSQEVRNHFDVVGFDPRGVGASAPLECLPPARIDAFLATDMTPDDPAEVTVLTDVGVELGNGCAAAGELAAHVETASVAKDMDVLRAVLGDAFLSYLGKSYGTYLGAVYAEQFPQRVGRFVLDGALDPALSDEQVNSGQAKGFEQALRAYVEDCLAGADCPLRGTVDDGVRQIEDLLAGLDQAPLRTGGPRLLTESLGYLAVAYPLYASQLWPSLSEALAAGLRGDGKAMLALADAYAMREPNGRYADNSSTVIYAVNCLDRAEGETTADTQAFADELAQEAPTFGRYLAWSSLPCSTWPIPPVGSTGPISAEGAAPILVVGTTRDPATPYAWAQSLAAQLSSGRLLSYDGDGHTAYATGSTCIDDAVDAYLVAGEQPAEGARC